MFKSEKMLWLISIIYKNLVVAIYANFLITLNDMVLISRKFLYHSNLIKATLYKTLEIKLPNTGKNVHNDFTIRHSQQMNKDYFT